MLASLGGLATVVDAPPEVVIAGGRWVTWSARRYARSVSRKSPLPLRHRTRVIEERLPRSSRVQASDS